MWVTLVVTTINLLSVKMSTTSSSLRGEKQVHWISRSCFTRPELEVITSHLSGRRVAPSGSNHSKQATTAHTLKGGETTPTSRRVFYDVNQRGERKRDSRGRLFPPYGISIREGQRGPGPVDAVRKIVHRTLQESAASLAGGTAGRAGETTLDIPSSVQTAVSRAIRQNFMCDCTDGQCVTPAQCYQLGEAVGARYLEDYRKDAPSSFTKTVTVFLQEQGKKKVRRYTGCYRRLTNPNKHCIRKGIYKETVATYMDTFDPHKTNQ